MTRSEVPYPVHGTDARHTRCRVGCAGVPVGVAESLTDEEMQQLATESKEPDPEPPAGPSW